MSLGEESSELGALHADAGLHVSYVTMLRARGVAPVLAVFRAVGGFPYVWRPGRQVVDVRVSWVAVTWSAVVTVVMVTFCVVCITMHYMRQKVSHKIINHISITYFYLLVSLLYLYLAVNARRLAKVLRLLAAAGVSVWRRCWGLEDAPVMVAVGVVLAGTCLSLSSHDFSASHPSTEVLRQVGDRTADLSITVLLTLFYALVKLLSVEMEDTVGVLARATATERDVDVNGDLVCPTTDISTSRRPSSRQNLITVKPHPPILQQHHLWTLNNDIPNLLNTATPEHALPSPPPSRRPSRPPARAPLTPYSTVLHLLALDDILREVVDYASPPLLLLLLNSVTSTTIFLYSAMVTSSAYT